MARFASSGPPVKQCKTAEGALPHFLLQDFAGVGVRVTRMDHQRQPGLARRRDVIAEALFLRFARAVVVEIVEAGFADGDDFVGFGQRDDVGCADIELFIGVMRMGS